MVANPSWDPNGAWTNVLDDGDPWVTIPAHWDQGWFGASGITSPVNSTSPKNNSANLAISGGVLNMTVGNISGTPYGSLLTTNPNNSATSTGITFTPPYAFECQVNIPGPAGSVLVPNWIAVWSDGQNWPGDGEVDTIESLGVPDWNSTHIHDSQTEGAGPQEGGTFNMSPHPYGLHTVGHYRTATSVQVYYDGVLVKTMPINTTSPHFLVLTHTYNGSADVLPSVLGVHWVRVWTPGGSGGSSPPTTGMTVSATASGSQSSPGVALSVRVLTGGALAASQAGATVHNESLSAPQLTLTPVSSGSLLVGAVASSSPSQFTGRDATTTFYQNVGDAVTNESYLTFRATDLSTAGTPVTAGATGPAAPSQLFGVMAEIQAAAGNTLAEDTSAPPAVFAAALTATTAGFTPPGGALLVALASANYNNAGTPTVAMTVTDSSGLTWTQLVGNSGPAGQDLASVWVAGGVAGGTGDTGPISGPPATARPLIVSAAPRAGTDVYGNPFPQGIQVGAATAPQVSLLPFGSGAQIQFAVPAPLLSNIPNMSAGAATAALASLVMSGPALAAAGVKDWVQIVLFSNDNGGTASNLQFRCIDTSGNVTIAAEFNAAKWLFNELIVAAGTILAQDPANPGAFEPWHSLGNFPSGTTTRGQYRLTPMGELELDITLTGTPTAGAASFPNTMPAAYRPSVNKHLVIAQGGTLGICTVNTTGVVTMTIGAGGSATADVSAVVNLS